MREFEGIDYIQSPWQKWSLLFKMNPDIIDVHKLIECCDNKDTITAFMANYADFHIIEIADCELNIKSVDTLIVPSLSFTIKVQDNGIPHIYNLVKHVPDTQVKASFLQWYNAVPKNWELTIKNQSELFTTRAEVQQITRNEFIDTLKEIGVTCNPVYFGQW